MLASRPCFMSKRTQLNSCLSSRFRCQQASKVCVCAAWLHASWGFYDRSGCNLRVLASWDFLVMSCRPIWTVLVFRRPGRVWWWPAFGAYTAFIGWLAFDLCLDYICQPTEFIPIVVAYRCLSCECWPRGVVVWHGAIYCGLLFVITVSLEVLFWMWAGAVAS